MSTPSSRRRFLTQTGAAILAAAAAPGCLSGAGHRSRARWDDNLRAMDGRFSLPDLPYAPEELAPGWDAASLHLHHADHHGGHVSALNAELGRIGLSPESLRELLATLHAPGRDREGLLRYHAGAHANHSLFWTCLRPNGGGDPPTEVASALSAAFGSVDGFREKFRATAMGVFGSGWAWLIRLPDGSLALTRTAEEDHPWMRGIVDMPGEPLLALDVWEHAYYTQHQNRRADHVTAFLQAVNWDTVAARLHRTRS